MTRGTPNRITAIIEAINKCETYRTHVGEPPDGERRGGMRNRISHGYILFLVSPEIIRRTIDTDLPGIIGVVRRKLGQRH